MKLVINGEVLEVSGGGALPEGTVAIKPLTQAEYTALTDEEKQADVVYAITDDAGSSGSGGSFEEVYSTEETRIGTWIDGKPLYRKTITGRAANINVENPIGDPIGDIDVVASITATYHGGGIVWYPTSLMSSSNNTSVYAKVDTGGQIKVFTNLSVVLNNDIFVTVEYTKTTDTGGTV